MNIEELAKKIEDVWQSFRRHRHQGQALDQSEQIAPGTSGGGTVDLTTGVSGALPVANGGTGAVNAADARTNLGISSGWTLVSYATVSDTEITITGLDLAADLQYHFIVQCRQAIAPAIIYGRCNGDSTGGGHLWASQTVRYAGVATESNAGEDSGGTKWELNGGAGNTCHEISMMLGHNGGTPMATWTTGSSGTASGSAFAPATTNGGGNWNSADNVTSIKFIDNSGNSADWRVWALKANTA